MKNNLYNNFIIEKFSSFQKEYKEEQINKDQLNFLLGFLIKNEVNRFVDQQIDSILPAEEETQKQITFINYKINKKLSHAR